MYCFERLHCDEPGMPCGIVETAQHPLFVVPHQRDHTERRLGLESEYLLHASLRIWTAIDIVAEEDECVLGLHLGPDLGQQIEEGLRLAVDIADSNNRHTIPNAIR